MLEPALKEQSLAASLPNAQASATPTLWRNKQYLALLGSYTMSLFGNSFHSIALNLWVLMETGSARMMSVLLITNLLISALFGSIAGTVADRVNRRKLMMIIDLLRCVLVLGIALFVALPGTSFWAIVPLTGTVTFLGLFQSPAFNASLTTIVGKEHIQRATGLMNLADNIARTAGFSIGGIFVAAFGGAWAIVFDGATFLLSFLLVWLAGPFPSPKPAQPAAPKSFKQDLLGGFRYVWKDAVARSVVILSPTLGLFFMSSMMLTQVLAVKDWKASPFELGLIEACIPLGYLIGAGIIVALGPKLRRRGWLVMGGLLLLGPGYVYLSASSSAPASIPAILLIGFLFSFCTLLINIMMRLEVSEELQGRVFGIIGSLMSVAPSAGLVVASSSADRFGAANVMFVIGLLLLLFAIAAVTRLEKIRSYR